MAINAKSLPPETLRAFAGKLIAKRTEKGWTQTELAKRATPFVEKGHFGRDSVSNYENARAFPTPTSLTALCKALGCKPEDIVPGQALPLPDVETPFSMMQKPDGLIHLRVNDTFTMSEVADIMVVLDKATARRNAAQDR